MTLQEAIKQVELEIEIYQEEQDNG